MNGYILLLGFNALLSTIWTLAMWFLVNGPRWIKWMVTVSSVICVLCFAAGFTYVVMEKWK